MSELSSVLKDAVPPSAAIPAAVIERRVIQRRRRLQATTAAAMAAIIMVVSLSVFGGGSSDKSQLVFQDILSVTGDYEPIGTRTELAAASDIVVEAVLVEAIDGRIFGESPDDEFANRYLRLVFESSDVNERLLVEVDRPGESPSFDEVVAAAPIGTRSVLYLSRIDIPDSEAQFWHGLPEGEDLFRLTLPEGWILEQDDLVLPQGSFPLDVPLESQGVLEAWLPDSGPKLPE